MESAVDNDAFHRQLEQLGSREVRARIVTMVYLGTEATLAMAWLERRAAARAAAAANSRAATATVIAIFSLIVAIVFGVFLFLQ
jgi:hypothetical protein